MTPEEKRGSMVRLINKTDQENEILTDRIAQWSENTLGAFVTKLTEMSSTTVDEKRAMLDQCTDSDITVLLILAENSMRNTIRRIVEREVMMEDL